MQEPDNDIYTFDLTNDFFNPGDYRINKVEISLYKTPVELFNNNNTLLTATLACFVKTKHKNLTAGTNVTLIII